MASAWSVVRVSSCVSSRLRLAPEGCFSDAARASSCTVTGQRTHVYSRLALLGPRTLHPAQWLSRTPLPAKVLVLLRPTAWCSSRSRRCPAQGKLACVRPMLLAAAQLGAPVSQGTRLAVTAQPGYLAFHHW
jgi:hypothetical protein